MINEAEVNRWLVSVDRWAASHSITRHQAIEIAFYDQCINEEGETMRDLYWGNASEYAEEYKTWPFAYE